jgi:hypothetical protein
VRSSAWIWDFSSTHNTSARSGGSRYNPTTSRTLSMNWGSADSFQVCSRCGLSPNARQIREIAVWLIPTCRAIDRVDQWVSWLGGGRSRVATITRSTWSSAMVRGRPGRGSSARPSSRSRTNRPRHLATVWGQMPSCSATATLVLPLAQASTIRARKATAWALVRRRAQRSRVCRSSWVSTNGALGLPRSAMPRTLPLTQRTNDSGH